MNHARGISMNEQHSRLRLPAIVESTIMDGMYFSLILNNANKAPMRYPNKFALPKKLAKSWVQ
jgi:hypothetical protein